MVFPAVGLKNAFLDASIEKVSTGGSVAPMYCFLHEPPNQEKFFNILKVSGTITVLALFSAFCLSEGAEKARRMKGRRIGKDRI